MRSKLYDNFSGWKVWQRPTNKGRGYRFEVRQGNRVLAFYPHLHMAQAHAKALMNSWWDEQARVLKEIEREDKAARIDELVRIHGRAWR